MAKKAFSAKDFLSELTAFAEEQRQLIETACVAFPVDHAARDIRITKVQNSFRFFAQTYFPHYIQGESSVFHDWVFDNLQKYIDDTRGHELDISAPRGEAKSTLITQVFVMWVIITGRKKFIPIVMDALDQAQAMLEAIKVELESNPRLRMDFPNAVGAGRVWNVGIALTQQNIKLQAFGSGKRMRGIRHGPYRPDLVIVDDIENDDNVRSKDQRDKLEGWLRKTVEPLGPPDGTMDIVYLNTILHYDSVANRMHRDPLWKSFKFKAIIEYPARMDLWQKWEEIFLNDGEEPADLYYQMHQKEMDLGAVVSWPSKRPLLMLMKKRAANRDAFDSEYQNEPGNDESAPFKNLTYWVQPCRDWVFFGSHDPSLGKHSNKGDPAAILVGGFDREHGILDVVEARIARMLPTLQISTLIELQREYTCLVWAIETVQFQEFLKDQILTESRKAGVPIPARGVTPSADKDLRIMSLQPHVANGTIRIHNRQTVLIEQLKYYPEAKNDDGPDALHMLFTVAYSSGLRSIPRIVVGKKRENYGIQYY